MEEPPLRILLEGWLLTVLRRRRLIAGVFAALMPFTIASALLRQPTYQARAKILVTANVAEISTDPRHPTELIRTTGVSREQLNTEVQILCSRDLIAQVLRDVGVRADAASVRAEAARKVRAVLRAPSRLLRDAYRRLDGVEASVTKDPFDEEVARILAATECVVVAGSTVIEVGYTDTDARWAADFVNRLVAAYVERHDRLQRIAEAEDFFTEQSEMLRQKLAASEATLRELRARAGPAGGENRRVAASHVDELGAELARTRITLAAQQERVAFLRQVRGKVVQTGRVGTPELLALEARRAELLTRYHAGSGRMQEIEEQIATLREIVSSYDSLTAPAVSSGGDGTDLLSAETELAALRAKEAALEREIDESHRQAEAFEAARFELARLERQAKLDEELYLSYVRTAEKARLSTAIERSQILRLTVLERAGIPLQPEGPSRGRVVGFGLLAGLTAAIGAAFVREHFDTTLKTAADVRLHGGVEILSVLPDRG
jgi:uncharacterized protein involved in exopolysaccharide biosynthesis